MRKSTGFYVCCAFILFQTIACNKDIPLPVENKPGTLVDEARLHFESEVISMEKNGTVTGVSGMGRPLRQLFKKNAQWEKAFIKDISTGKAVIIPLKYPKGYYYKLGRYQQEVSLDYLSYLMIYKVNNEMHTELVTWFPDADYWDNVEPNQPFKGKIIVENWQGHFIKGYAYDGLGNASPIVPDALGESSQNTTSQEQQQDCTEYWLWNCVTAGGSTECTFWLNERFCTNGEPKTTIILNPEEEETGPGDYTPPPPDPCDPVPSVTGFRVRVAAPCDTTAVPELPVLGPVIFTDILNKVNNPCMKNAVTTLINNDLNGKISEIIGDLNGDKSVIVNIIDVAMTSNGKPAMITQLQPLDENVIGSTISLSQAHLENSTKENTASVIMHEILHAYFSYTGQTNIQQQQHDLMATNYIIPMAQFLSSLYGISEREATALAWSGLADSKSYTESEQFQFSTGTLTKSEIGSIYADFVIGSSGTNVCN